MSRKLNKPLAPILLFAVGVLMVGGVGAAEKSAATDQQAETQSTPQVKMPDPINIGTGSAGLLSKDVLSVRDDTTVRPSTDHELVIMNLVHRCNEAIYNNNFAEAESQIKIMTQLLPDQSLTLLRMRAWYAVSSGDDSEARKLYRQMLDRTTNDENAGINLAILEARAGRVDEAKKILNNLANHHPDSEQLNAVRQAFGLVRPY
jgi:Thioredoxin domain-containing protein